MLVHEVPKEKIRYCIEKLQALYDPSEEEDVKLLKKSLSLYRNGAVYNVTIEDEVINASVVDDGNTYEIELELDFMEISFCSCGESEDLFCVHKLATLFYVFSLFDSPGEFFKRWKNDLHFHSQIKARNPSQSPVLIDAGERPYQEDSPESWIAYFEQKYEQFQKKRKMSFSWGFNRETNLAGDIYEDFYSIILDTQKPSSPMGDMLFQIYAALFTFEKILESASDVYVSIYTHQTIKKYLNSLVNDIVEHIYMIHSGNHTPTEKDEKILHNLPDRIMNLLLNSRDFQYDRFYLFQIICSNLLNRKEWIRELEQQFIIRGQKEEKLKKLGKANFSAECRLARAHFSFMLQKDQEAIKIASEGASSEVYYYTTWFKALAQSKQWDRFVIWLPFIEEKMNDYIHQYGEQQLKRELTTFYLFFIREYANEKGLESIYIHTLQTWLPYSYTDFCEYLLEQKDYQKWAELQLFAGLSIEELSRELLKEVEKEDRSCLLPLYHNAVEEMISMKNRDAYRQAVKYLRKLRTHYRALKKQQTWEHYIQLVATKYKRLRAFQEELRKGKGKLIDD